MAHYGDLQGASLQSQELLTVSTPSSNEPLIVLSNPTSPPITSPVQANSPDTTNPFEQNYPAYNSSVQNVPPQNSPQQNVPQQNVPQQTVPQQNVPQQTVPQQNVPQQTVPQQNVPQQTVPQQNVPQQNVPQQNVPSATSARPLIEEMIPANIKGGLMEYCGKNKLQLPVFKRDAPQSGTYKTILTWSPPNSEDVFEEKASYPSKRDAENKVSSIMLARIKEWNSNNTQADVGDSKGQLQRLVLLNNTRFLVPKYSTVCEGIGLFACTLTVADSLGPELVTDGRGVGKKTAEKGAASKMIPILTDAISSNRRNEPMDGYRNDIERLEATRAVSFPDYQIEYQPVEQENGDRMRYLLQSCSLILRKENFPSICVATSSGIQLEEAKLACAKLALEHLVSIKRMIEQPN